MFCARNVHSGQRRVRLVGKTRRGDSSKITGLADGHGLPVALPTASALVAELNLVDAALEERIVADVPE
jgi:hypothetical protein